MKKLLCVLLITVFLVGCSTVPAAKTHEETEKAEVRAVWISYYELKEMKKENFESNVDTVFKNIKSIGINRIYLHVRSFCDSIYPSAYFPLSSGFDGSELETFIKKCREYKVEIYAWINPYRISSDKNREHLTNQTALEHIDSVRFTESGAYFDPSSEDTRKLILDGVRELVNGYDIDGIHFDDYFYPSQEESFDDETYKCYAEKTENPLPLADFRRAGVDALIGGAAACLKGSGKKLSIAPAADITANYERRFADVIGWCEKGLIDEVVPELYFGYCHKNEKFCFENILEEWTARLTPTDTELVIGLAPYKLGKTDGFEAEEWENGVTVIPSQICTVRNAERADGFAFFSYSSIFGGTEKQNEQLENIKEICK